MFLDQEYFKGKITHTARRPKGRLELDRKRVGVIGSGAAGIQVIQAVAGQ